ncbi:hypothetical protein M406DRAFT_354979 [Cryphonectria parasitica EP155]|uniref:Uncharacterized protein n=1 Tax=Cryphonectria parasitica (strain ATCC 38755 / EP155) TaxID=660469 RepID=A0A9P4Y935_CRYP1|nr:uncharacterized protein M406DRAFT_354979 [Cryphonectria parasitica EP155]KAF3768700.1 hypothetical protein M406DRAFT_354979 [Cryphonectria parasitica EP155]
MNQAFDQYRIPLSFHYSPNNPRVVFKIYYDRDLDGRTWADSFFPSTPPDLRALPTYRLPRRSIRIGPLCIYETDGHAFIKNILRHEFGHVIGMRHWNAQETEQTRPSRWIPGSCEDNHHTVMVTGVHPSAIKFWPSDWEYLGRAYSGQRGYPIRYVSPIGFYSY